MHTGNTRIMLRIFLLLLALLLVSGAFLCFLTSQNIRSAYNLLSSISPSAALKLRPEQHSVESSGITMQLASV